MKHESGELSGAGGLAIYWQAWLPEEEPRAVVVLAHGASEHSGRYAWVGEQLAARGYPVYAVDHRGHGRSAGSRALVDRMSNVVSDLDQLVVRAGAAHPGRPVFLLGHSMGGAVSLAYVAEHQDRLAGLVLSAPLAVVEAASPATRVIGRLLSAVAPKLGVYEIDPTAVSRDPAVVADYVADPLNCHDKLPARTVAELSIAVRGFQETLPRLTLPLLVMHGSADRIVPPAATELVADLAASEDKTIRRWDGLYHELLNEPERQQVLDVIADWLDARTLTA